MDLVELFDIPKHFGGGSSYIDFFAMLFNTLFNGWLARLLGFLCLGASIWFWVRRDQLLVGLWFFIFAFIFAYGWVLFKMLGVA